MTQKRIAIVDDEEEILTGFSDIFREEGYEIQAFNSPLRALAEIPRNPPDLVLVDLSMPEMNGVSLATELGQAIPSLPIAALTVSGDPNRTMQNLGIFVDYMRKTDGLDDLVERVENILKRIGNSPHLFGEPEEISIGSLYLNQGQRLCSWKHRPVKLTSRGFALLWCLVANEGMTLQRNQLLDAVWGRDALDIGDRAVDQAINRLRDAFLDADPEFPARRVIQTQHGIGYRFMRP